MASIQGLMARVQEQLQTHSKLRFSNPALAQELKRKAEGHLEVLMQLAEAQQQQHIDGMGGSMPQLQDVLQELQVQLDLEQQAMLTASKSTEADAHKASAAEPIARAHNEGSSSSSSSGPALRQQLLQSEAEVRNLQERLLEAESKVSRLQQQLIDAEDMLLNTADELSEHRELQMAYDKQCQDLYKLRMQLQLVQNQGNDAASLAASTNKQHKQNLAWLMEAHRKEVHEAHRKNQDLIHEVQQLRLKVLEQEQQLWSMGATTAPQPQQLGAGQQQEQQQQQQQEQQAQDAATGATEAEPEQQPAVQQQLGEAEQQLQQLQASAEQLAAEKQQLMRSLQDSQREQAVLLVELQNLRSSAAAAEAAAAVAASGSSAAEAAAVAEAAAAAEEALKRQLEAAVQQRDSLMAQVQDLQANLQQARDAAAKPAAAAAPASVGASAAAAHGLARLDAAAAVQQLKVAKVEMAGLKVQLADARRELRVASGRAAAAEAALQQQAADFEARLAKLQAWYTKQAAVVAELRQGKAPEDGQVGFTNTNRFWVRREQLYEFLKHWVFRETQLQQQDGFLGLQVAPGTAVTADGGVVVRVSSLWDSIPAWEAWSKSVGGTQQHMPPGVFQYVPAKGEGFPEAFVPFRDYDEAVNAKY